MQERFRRSVSRALVSVAAGVLAAALVGCTGDTTSTGGASIVGTWRNTSMARGLAGPDGGAPPNVTVTSTLNLAGGANAGTGTHTVRLTSDQRACVDLIELTGSWTFNSGQFAFTGTSATTETSGCSDPMDNRARQPDNDSLTLRAFGISTRMATVSAATLTLHDVDGGAPSVYTRQ